MGEKVFTLRMDEELFEKVKNVADKNKRSIAKEIEYQLEKSLLQDDNDIPPPPPEDIAPVAEEVF